MAAMISAQVSSAGATGELAPSATAMPRWVQAAMSIWLPTLPVCAMNWRRGNLSISWRVMCVRSRVSTMMSASLRRTDNCPTPLTVLV